MTPAHILVIFLTSGVFLGGAIGLYEPLVKFGEAGATVPISGFGYALSKGTIEAVKSKGVIGGAFSGGIELQVPE